MYIEVCNGFNDRNHFIPVTEYMPPVGKKDVFVSLFQFVEKPESVSSYNGSLYTPFFVIDIDGEGETIEERIKNAREETLNILQYLEVSYELDLNVPIIAFSGHKGFHIYLPGKLFGGFDKLPNLPQILKKVAIEMLNGFKYDPVIYHKSRIFRALYSVHGKTGLYKCPMSFQDLRNMSVAEVLDYAKEPHTDFEQVPTDANEYMQELYKRFVNDPERKATFTIQNNEIHENVVKQQKFREKPCIQQLIQGGATEGNRHNYMMRIANDMFKKGYTDEMIFGMLQAYNRTKVNPPTSDEEIEIIVRDAKKYDYGCNDPVLKQFCDHNCPLYKVQQAESKILTIEQMNQMYNNFVKHIEHNKISVDHWIPITKYCRGLYPGEVMIILGGTGTGKTAFAQNFVLQTQFPSIFFSFELPIELLHERMIAIGEGIPVADVERLYKEDKFPDAILQKYKHHYFVTEPMSLDEIEETINHVKTINPDLKIAVIDYLSLIRYTKSANPYQRTSEIARELKYVAKRTKTLLVVLSQVNRASGSGTMPLTRNDARDSGAIEEVADLLLGVWRPNRDRAESDVDDYVIGILKNRKGKEGIHIVANFHRSKLQIEGVKEIKYVG